MAYEAQITPDVTGPEHRYTILETEVTPGDRTGDSDSGDGYLKVPKRGRIIFYSARVVTGSGTIQPSAGRSSEWAAQTEEEVGWGPAGGKRATFLQDASVLFYDAPDGRLYLDSGVSEGPATVRTEVRILAGWGDGAGVSTWARPCPAALATGSPEVDAFSRSRVSIPHLLFSAVHDENKRADLWWDETAAGGGVSYDSNSKSVTLDVDGTSGAMAARQSRIHVPYRPASSQLILCTFSLAPAAASLRQRVGYFDASDGIFLQTDDDVLSLVLRTSTSGSPVEDVVPRADWDDPLDGSGRSGLTLNPAARAILILDLQWLGVGRCRAGFDIDGRIVYVYEWLNANQAGQTLPYMSGAQLPVRYEIENTGAGTAATLRQICAAVLREGSQEEPGVVVTADNGITAVAVPSSGSPKVGLLGIRRPAGCPRSTLQLLFAQIFNLDTTMLHYEIHLNPDMGSPAGWTNYSDCAQVNLTGPTLVGDGERIVATGYVAGSASSRGDSLPADLSNAVLLGAASSTTRDEAWIVANRPTGSGDALASLKYKEIR